MAGPKNRRRGVAKALPLPPGLAKKGMGLKSARTLAPGRTKAPTRGEPGTTAFAGGGNGGRMVARTAKPEGGIGTPAVGFPAKRPGPTTATPKAMNVPRPQKPAVKATPAAKPLPAQAKMPVPPGRAKKELGLQSARSLAPGRKGRM